MYESFFGFKDTPFRLSADEKFRYAHDNYIRAAAYIAFALEQGEGFVMITGRPGSGKTTLCRDVISEIDSSKIESINLVTSQLQAEELLRRVALEYELPAEKSNKATLLTGINRYLADLHSRGKRSIIFLDEAQNLTSNGLEELRLLSNLQEGNQSLLQIVLIGHEELRESVLSPGMEHIQQRMIATCHLEPMTAGQVEGYITHRLNLVGWKMDPSFQQGVFSLIHMATQGVARQINHVMSQLLLNAAIEDKHHLSNEDVLMVIHQLVDESRLTLVDGLSFDSFRESYLATKLECSLQTHSIASPGDDVCELNDDCHENSSSNNHKLLAAQKMNAHGTAVVQELDEDNENYIGLEVDWDFPDTDWLAWDEENQNDISSQQFSKSANGSDEPIEVKQETVIMHQTFAQDVDDITRWEDGNEPPFGKVHIDPQSIQSSMRSDPSSTDVTSGQKDHDSDIDRYDHQWGGVMWMSNSDNRGRSDVIPDSSGSEDRFKQCSINWQRLAAGGYSNNTSQGYEGLKLPSVWVDSCPYMHTSHTTEPFQRGVKSDFIGYLKRSLVHIIYLVSLGIIVFFLLQLLPNNLSLKWQRSIQEYFGLMDSRQSTDSFLVTNEGSKLSERMYESR